MGDVKNSVKGSGPKKKLLSKKAEGNLIKQVDCLRDEVSRLTAIKDDDTLKEGDAAIADNTRKAALESFLV